MQHSYYNVIVQGTGAEHVAFNTLLGSLCVLDRQAMRDYQALDGPNLPALEQAGLVLQRADDQLELQQRHFLRDIDTRDTFGLVLAPGYSCNFACPYCYQQGLHKSGEMTSDMLGRIMQLVQQFYERDHFDNFYLGWYGGEPLLYIETIEEFSGMLLPFCREHGIATSIDVITNTSLATPQMAARLAACGVSNALPTFEGMRQMQNERRMSKDSSDTFDSVLQGIENLRAAGISVMAIANLDKRNVAELPQLQQLFASRGVPFNYDMLKDYYNEYALGGHHNPQFDLFTEDEYAEFSHQRFVEEVPQTALNLSRALAPIRNFCRRPLENYLVIDGEGDVYKCDGWMGHDEWKIFNVFDDIDVKTLHTASFDPHAESDCATCNVLPLCRGYCRWEHEAMGFCHMYKRNIGSYVLDYRACFGDVKMQQPVVVLVPPRDLDAFYAAPFGSRGIAS